MQNYPRARKQARQLCRSLTQLVSEQTSAPTQIATVADASALLSQGIVNATTHQGPIQVAGVPPNTVCPGSQIYVRQLGVKSLYVYDGLAGAYNNRLTSSGSIQSITGTGPAASTQLISSTGTITTSYGISFTASAHFYVAFAFSLAFLPPAGTTMTLLDLPFLNAGNTAVAGGLTCAYLPTGQLSLVTTGWNGYGSNDTTSEYFAPRRTWWVYLQLGAGMTVNGLQPASSTSFSLFTNSNFLTPPAATYGVFVLGNHLYKTPAAIGSWISKISIGYAASGTLPTAVPQSDSQVPQDHACWLCTSGDVATNVAYPNLMQQFDTNGVLAGQYISTGPY